MSLKFDLKKNLNGSFLFQNKNYFSEFLCLCSDCNLKKVSNEFKKIFFLFEKTHFL